MNTKTILPVLAAVLLFTACNNQDTANDVPLPAATNTAAPSGVMLNPAHGMPGHRCDIAVGAPLNTPAANVVQPFTPPPIAQPTAPVTNPNPLPHASATMPPQQTAPGFSGKPNPEHGLPGHRCDLDVGAILP